MKIAFQGIAGANSHLACLQFYPQSINQPYQTFEEVFLAVQNQEVDCGLVPLENSYAGRVAEIHHLLQKYQLNIVAEHFFTVNHQLAGVQGAKITDITTAISHPQALMQCQNFLQKLNIAKQESINTAVGAELVFQHHKQTGQKNLAAICSHFAIKHYNLQLLAENIQDAKEQNMTIFITIAKIQPEIDFTAKPSITSLFFTIRNIPGALYKALGGFATNNVSIVKLESYIPGGVSKQARFFISIHGHPQQQNVRLALEELGFFSQEVKLLGIYYADTIRG
ncbi:MAG: prephenate dehydratase [Proteobacteria bacterium]|nr:prephenate dehydratase [Pseudomonadota bacterium]